MWKKQPVFSYFSSLENLWMQITLLQYTKFMGATKSYPSLSMVAIRPILSCFRNPLARDLNSQVEGTTMCLISMYFNQHEIEEYLFLNHVKNLLLKKRDNDTKSIR